MNLNNTDRNIAQSAAGGERESSHRAEMITSLKAEADSKRRWSDRLADRITAMTGSMVFLGLNVLWFAVWIMLNMGLVPGIEPFDPFPFGLLTMVVSLEAIILAIAVLISQNRAARIDDLREEVHLQINVIAEHELTKVMEMLLMLLKKHGIDVSDDSELMEMLEPTNVGKLQEMVEEQIMESQRNVARNQPD